MVMERGQVIDQGRLQRNQHSSDHFRQLLAAE